jgi:O-antigen ligase
MNTLLVAATSAFLVLAPFPGSAGLRVSMLLLAAVALLSQGRALREALAALPRGFVTAWAAYAALAIASLAWSVDPAYSRGELKSELLYGALAFVVFHFAGSLDARLWRAWWRAALAGTALMATWFVLQELLPIHMLRQSMVEQRGPWSTHLVLVMPLLFAIAWPAPWGASREPLLQAGALALLLAAAWQTGNRMMWIAFGVQLLLAIALARAIGENGGSSMRTARRLGLAVVAVVALAFAGSLVEHNERFFGSQAPFATAFERDLRPRIWATGVNQIVEAPWVGHGYGREIVSGAFIPLTPPHYPQLRHAHNTFLDVAIELGVVGLAIFVAILGALALAYGRLARNRATAALGVLGLAVLAGFVEKNLTDDFMHRHNALVFWALNGMLLGLARARSRPPPASAAEPR